MSYDHAIVSLHLPEHPVAVDAPDHRRRSFRGILGTLMDGGGDGLVPASPWLTALAFTVVALPFAVALVMLIGQSGSHLTLADDLALIDLHTRRALTWKQQLGVFDHYGWNHPGPSYFYLLSVVYRVLGSGAKSMFIGSTLINGLCAIACVAVVRRRSTPARALWASVWICGLIALFAASGHVATTYSESVLGGLVSPWNPMVVTFPLLLTILLCAASFDRSGLSLLVAVGTGSFVVQTDVSALPVVAVVGGLAFLVWLVTSVVDLAGLGIGKRASSRRRAWLDHRHWVVGPILALGSMALIVLMWVPPVIQQRSNHPGNLTLIARFFTKHHGTYPLSVGWKSLLSVDSVVVRGPSEVMRSDLGLVVRHPGIAWTVTILAGTAALVAMVVGVLQRRRFPIGVGALGLAGGAAVVVSSTRVVGFIFGYLLIWAVVLPVTALISPGTVVATRPAASACGRGRPAGDGLDHPAGRVVRCGCGRVRRGRHPGDRYPAAGGGLGSHGGTAGRARDTVTQARGPGLRRRRRCRHHEHTASGHRGVHRTGQSPRPGRLPPHRQPRLADRVRTGLSDRWPRIPSDQSHDLGPRLAVHDRLRGKGRKHGGDRHRPLRGGDRHFDRDRHHESQRRGAGSITLRDLPG